VAGRFLNATGELERLGDIAAVTEFSIDADRIHHWIGYEWTG
jgi:hypothetical protein